MILELVTINIGSRVFFARPFQECAVKKMLICKLVRFRVTIFMSWHYLLQVDVVNGNQLVVFSKLSPLLGAGGASKDCDNCLKRIYMLGGWGEGGSAGGNGRKSLSALNYNCFQQLSNGFRKYTLGSVDNVEWRLCRQTG